MRSVALGSIDAQLRPGLILVQVGASYLCSKGTLGENEPVGNRTDMFAAEVVRSTGQQLAAADKTAAAAFKLTLDLAKASLSQRMGEQARHLLACSLWMAKLSHKDFCTSLLC